MLARQLNTADVVIENFRLGVMENWGLGPEEIKITNPKLVYARISGYGQIASYPEMAQIRAWLTIPGG